MLTNWRFLESRALESVLLVYNNACVKRQQLAEAVRSGVHCVSLVVLAGGQKEHFECFVGQ